MKKKILILGGTSDMAMAIGQVYAREGHDLVMAGRKVERLLPYQEDIKLKCAVEVELMEFDAEDISSHEVFVQEACLTKLDLAVCVFGYLGDQSIAEQDWKECERIIHCNYTGAVSILNRIAEKFLIQGSGTIIGISSVAGDRGRSSNYLYGSAKAGFTVYLDGLRNRLYHSGLHVMTVKPGFVATKMTGHLDLPPALTSSPEQVAEVIYKAQLRKKNTIYVSFVWRWIMLIIRSIPEQIFKKLKM
ncbi:SDR family oxidoreductase [Reichenbachiella agarivorans]|uniref:SDR family oxidoreductase n=1 Tax=Reichenbachiella agarivorans TaxID=2979464 RepID=A0ABY6CPH3_9BACT|nr:SDR family oxidoreductase [Reichenbachiella agarivorans]UXP32426.1 SDR family oxidoreductase [Reichenbachiella agarivorans]